MADTLLYIIFKDTASEKNLGSQKIAVENLAAQVLAAAELIKANPEAVYAYVRQDLPVTVPKVEVSPESPAPVQALTPTPEPTNTIVTEDDMINVVFKDLKRTSKSEAIVRYFVQNSGFDLSVEQIATGSSMTKADLSVWLAQTGKKIPAITSTSRGVYKFDPNQLTS